MYESITAASCNLRERRLLSLLIKYWMPLFMATNLAYSQCDLKNANDVFELIKKNHPTILLNQVETDVLEKGIDVARQRPNPEIDAQSVIGDSVDGKTYTSAVTLKHTIELGGKRNSRIGVARGEFQAKKAFSQITNEDAIIDVVIKLYRLWQLYQLVPLYSEAAQSLKTILAKIVKRKSLSPEEQVEREMIELAANDYKLRITQLNSEKDALGRELSYLAGGSCNIPKKVLPYKVNIDQSFMVDASFFNNSKLEAARRSLALAKARLKLAKSNSVPDLKIGPTYEYEKSSLSGDHSVGIALTTSLPIFNVNGGGREMAAREVLATSFGLKRVEAESQLNLESWINKYNYFKKALRGISDTNLIEKRHQKVEALFKRGIISTALVIESHRQLIEFANTKFEFEQGATEALWNIYKIKGVMQAKHI